MVLLLLWFSIFAWINRKDEEKGGGRGKNGREEEKRSGGFLKMKPRVFLSIPMHVC